MRLFNDYEQDCCLLSFFYTIFQLCLAAVICLNQILKVFVFQKFPQARGKNLNYKLFRLFDEYYSFDAVTRGIPGLRLGLDVVGNYGTCGKSHYYVELFNPLMLYVLNEIWNCRSLIYVVIRVFLPAYLWFKFSYFKFYLMCCYQSGPVACR